MKFELKENASADCSAHSLPVPAEDVQHQVERILADPIFHNSKRCCTLLRFIVANTLNGHQENLKERIIGIELYGRSCVYITSEDATVRVAASELRKRLLQYYSDPMHKNELRIDVPVRSYVAEFCAPDFSAEEQEHKTATPNKQYVRWRVAAVFVLLLILSGILYRSFQPVSAIDRFWAPMLQSNLPVSISIGAPTADETDGNAAGIRSGAANSVITLHKFLSQQYVFPLTELNVETAITSYLGLRGKGCTLRFAPTTTLADLRGQPLVVIGSLRNEWSLHLGSNLRYHIPVAAPPSLNWIQDANNPSDQRWSVDMNAPYQQISSDYALVSRVYDQTTGQWWIGIAGLTGLGTLAAQQLIVDPEAISEVARHLPHDWDHKNLQIVLAVKILQGSPGKPRVLAVYSW